MQGEVGKPVSYDALEMALSLERFGRYLDWANGDRSRAIELYTLNTLISESLYTPLQMLEVALRNRIHAVMTEAVNESWFHEPGIAARRMAAEQLAKAIQDIEEAKKEPTPGRVVAALTFSFWTAMFGKDYETLWQTTLHKIGRKPDGKGLRRKDFSGPLAQIRSLRNRIAHHEPVIMWNLPKRHDSMMEMTGWLSPPAAEWCQTHCRFQQVYPAEPIALHHPSTEAKAGESLSDTH
ncbi:Abi family protein [Sinorhizobium medicae]|uniref:Abi family protein n=2 Tax=Sinorhizobium TaxID=28105 RepID=UPI002B1BDB2D|nr:Abi family protein [Sinorhizobium medicae]WQO48530.1 Abi family protein [Sinorhizobium medicae]